MPIIRAVAAVSIDGRIAPKDGSVHWSSPQDKEHLLATISAAQMILIGHTTYKTMEDMLGGKSCLVFTRSVRSLCKITDLLTHINADKVNMGDALKSIEVKRIDLFGGSQVYSYCLQRELVDELCLTVEPVVFGGGVALFDTPYLQKFVLKSAKQLNPQGTMLMEYNRPGAR